ncbi:MAG: gamma-glutamyltransferase, partial [Chloroflexota bacterium]|nr:gamma-glutamyltransferase [Chloroflexota bacterium]
MHESTQEFHFASRRSPVLARRGIVAATQPLAAQAGLGVLQAGGNAADAAVATAAALAVVEPMSTGIGGDCFALFYDAARGAVEALNGSGRAPAGLTLDGVRAAGETGRAIGPGSVHAVTVPGAAAGWADAVSRWGRRDLASVLAPAIELAEDGFAVTPVI